MGGRWISGLRWLRLPADWMSAGSESPLFLEEPLEMIIPALNKNQPAPSDQNRFDVARIEKLVASAMPNLCDLAKFLKWHDP